MKVSSLLSCSSGPSLISLTISNCRSWLLSPFVTLHIFWSIDKKTPNFIKVIGENLVKPQSFTSNFAPDEGRRNVLSFPPTGIPCICMGNDFDLSFETLE